MKGLFFMFCSLKSQKRLGITLLEAEKGAVPYLEGVTIWRYEWLDKAP
jgi:hypothetical protein